MIWDIIFESHMREREGEGNYPWIRYDEGREREEAKLTITHSTNDDLSFTHNHDKCQMSSGNE